MVQRTTTITVETNTFLVVRRAKAGLAWCPECGAEVDAITLTAEGFAEPETTTQVEQWLSTGRLHLWRTSEGAVQICVPSLLQCSA